ncbi:prenylated flavin chaperone LpdD [Paenibacillus sp. 23TSA30-6]|uniref:prenylated flavin chaperone LpdD n=1 Tax=Paenibacillus sp. 23TSA30-6 TaxID=2546104 RepID=UPI00178816E3|nr:hypothetical protein [Paenibacillus sp. 23TSA30-6]MBE0337729.1 hypothetical protein [Paenibacillus sp. 23TSA30-6]
MIHLEKESGRIRLVLDAYFMGEDIVVLISGGDQPHLGTITAGARLEPIQTVQLQAHKEFYITEEIAVRLRKEFAGNFAICCGAHMDHVTKDEIRMLTEMAIQLGKELIDQLKQKCL